jgi:hypothetical protein
MKYIIFLECHNVRDANGAYYFSISSQPEMNSIILSVLMCTTITCGAIMKVKRVPELYNNYPPIINTNLSLLTKSNCMQVRGYKVSVK